jgi:hypothetical protein
MYLNRKSGSTIQKSSSHPWRWQLGLAFLAQLFGGSRASAENQLDYRFEYYNEDNDRMTIDTHSVYFEQKLSDAVTAKGELVYDSISGATPTGTVLPSGKIVLTKLEDTRRAGNLELDWKLGRQTITPGFAYSKESDYSSGGISLGDAIEFNEKNTILQLGGSHNFDSVREANKTIWKDKASTEGIIGVSQLLSPKTIFNAAFTLGNDSGYLSDPYRLAGYVPTGFPFSIGVPERRPSHRNKEIVYTSLTQYFDPVNASLEGSYRFYHDSYGVFSHTVGLTWHQWLGKHLIVEPMFRFSEQSAADFYQTTFTGPFSANPDGFHSSDYRLSELYTVDYGLQATAVINDHFRIIAGYHRYEMNGLDGKTSADMYPKANVFTVGFSLLW